MEDDIGRFIGNARNARNGAGSLVSGGIMGLLDPGDQRDP